MRMMPGDFHISSLYQAALIFSDQFVVDKVKCDQWQSKDI
jgi:hypothetical protein